MDFKKIICLKKRSMARETEKSRNDRLAFEIGVAGTAKSVARRVLKCIAGTGPRLW